MDIADYRKAVSEGVEAASPVAVDPLAALASREPERADGQDRESATGRLRGSPETVGEADPIAAEIAVLIDKSKPTDHRRAALRTLQAAAFLGPKFSSYRAAYLEALRSVATDADEELRSSALEALALEKDGTARSLLLGGLQGRSQPLVPPVTALRLLAYDDHGVATVAAREVLAGKHDAETLDEALRILGSDPAAEDLLARTFQDSSMPAALRQTSASGLHNLNPQRFEALARRVVEDEKEDAGLRATALGALTHLPGYGGTRGDPAFRKSVDSLAAASSPGLRTAAARFLKR